MRPRLKIAARARGVPLTVVDLDEPEVADTLPSGGWSWCGLTGMSPGAAMGFPPTPPR